MKRKSLLIMLLVALFVPLAMNAQKKHPSFGPMKDLSSAERIELRDLNPITHSNEYDNRDMRDVGDYELVTASQTDWSGEYVIAYVASSTSAEVLTGKASGGNYGDHTTAAISSNVLAAADVASYKVTIEKVTYNNNTYYTIKQGSNYLYYSRTANNNYLYFGTSISSSYPNQYYWSISYSSNTLTITNVNKNTRKLQYNTGSPRFACYTTTQGAISLFKKIESSCPTPEGLAVNEESITENTATATWTAGDATLWNLRYKSTDASTWTTVNGLTAATYTFSSLTAATEYEVQVQADCGNEPSEWTSSVEFTTECDIQSLPFFCGFETTAQIACLGGYNWADNTNLSTSSYHAGSYCFMFEGNGSWQYLIFPEFDGTQAIALSFYYRLRSSSYQHYFKLGYAKESDLSDLTFYYQETATSQSYAEYTTTFPKGTKYVVLACGASSGTYYRLYVDDFNFTDAGCIVPTDIAVNDITRNSAVITWEQGNHETQWQVSLNGDDSNPVLVSTNSYSWTGLTPDTRYTFKVRAYCDRENQSEWSDVHSFTTEATCPAPKNLEVTDLMATSATFNWTSEAGQYTVGYAEVLGEVAVFEDGFENGLDANGWTVYTEGESPNTNGWYVNDFSSNWTNHGGSYSAGSFSWSSSAYHASNYLVTPLINDLQGTLKFWVYSNYADEYEVLLSLNGNSVSDFNISLQDMTAAPSTWTEVVIDLNKYAGHSGYIAIHHQFYDGNVILVDDFAIYATSYGTWTETTTTENSIVINGLNPETNYGWKVQADCGSEDGMSSWSSALFTTPSMCNSAPVRLSAEAAMNSADLSWDGFSDTYNVRYREGEPVATIILTTGDVWGDGSGYQMLLDADATAYTAGIADYSIFEYLIPANADYNDNTSNVVYNTSVSIQIPAGTYDWFITNPSPGDKVYIAGSNGNVGGRQDNYVFEGGKTYEFVPFLMSDESGDGVDVTITDGGAAWTTVNNVTNPYTLTNLTSATGYEFQVQGNNCDGNGGTTNWSASGFFTTIDVPAIPVESIVVNPNETEMNVGATYTILYTVLPEDASITAVTFSSDDEDVATVDENGNVTGVAAGTATITIAATDGSGVTGTFTVTVMNIDVEDITANDITMMSGETATISYTVLPANATDASVTFTSANTAIATVDADGVVTAVGVGETTITIASVQNPEVTTDITVTVTSDPNAVQFTVNAPANARPGDVITVEAVLTAPEEGDYGGFNGLILGLYYDNTAFEYVANSMVYGPVVQQAQQLNSFLTPGTQDGVVQLSIIDWTENSFVTAEGVVFSAQFTVLEGAAGNFNFTAQPYGTDPFSHEGENILYNTTPSTVEVYVGYTRTIIGYNNGGGWNMLASPLADAINPEDVVGMTSNNYDIYRFNENPTLVNGTGNEWENWKATGDHYHFDLEPGRGYIYANSNTVDITFYGSVCSDETFDVTLSKNAGAEFEGMNLVGNPFPGIAYLLNKESFYTMNDQFELVSVTNASIQLMEAIFVEATEDGERLTFTTVEPSKSAQVALNLSSGRGTVIDRAIVRFGEGRTLSKFQLNANSTKVYIPQDGKDYAVVYSEGNGEVPVNFKAEENGTYILSFNAEEVEFNYLHLIDNMTGKDIDLLQTPSYSFEANVTDYESRFKLVFATGTTDNSDNFAFYSNGNWIIGNEGEATLQVIDVTGRILSSETVNGSVSKNINAASGVYMLRLINGDNVKVQKIVVR